MSFSVSTELAKLLERAADLQRSVDTWNRWYVFSLGLVIIAAFAVGVTNRFVIARQRQLTAVQDDLLRAKDQQLRSELANKDRELRRELAEKDRAVANDLRDKDIKIGEAAGIAAKANERAAHATEEAARLSRDAEELKRKNLETEEDLEKQRLARVGLEQSLAPRRIAVPFPDPRLEYFRGMRIRISFSSTDAETQLVARRIKFAVENAGWVVTVATDDTPILGRVGISIAAMDETSSHAARELESLLLANSVEAQPWSLPPNGATAWFPPPGVVIGNPVVWVAIGEKPSPYFDQRTAYATQSPGETTDPMLAQQKQMLEGLERGQRERMRKLRDEWFPPGVNRIIR